MTKIKEGTLIRVHNPRVDSDNDMVDEHGELWTYAYALGDDDNLHRLKSLATGRYYLWYEDEFEVPDGD